MVVQPARLGTSLYSDIHTATTAATTAAATATAGAESLAYSVFYSVGGAASPKGTRRNALYSTRS